MLFEYEFTSLSIVKNLMEENGDLRRHFRLLSQCVPIRKGIANPNCHNIQGTYFFYGTEILIFPITFLTSLILIFEYYPKCSKYTFSFRKICNTNLNLSPLSSSHQVSMLSYTYSHNSLCQI